MIRIQPKPNIENGNTTLKAQFIAKCADGDDCNFTKVASLSYMDCTTNAAVSLNNDRIFEKRLALVIGNSNYESNPLPNPVNDARAITEVLERLGFEVLEYENLDQSEMKRVIDEFGQKLQHYDIGLFFYSGHGVQVNGENYLIPTDAHPRSEKEVEYECVNAGRILAEMETANNPTNIMILDACRENPFEKSWTRSLTSKGLAFMDAPTGSLIAYATAPGNVAYDDAGQQNSPYTSALLKYIETPGISILEMFQHIRTQVIKDTNGNQTPWESTSLTGNFYFKQE